MSEDFQRWNCPRCFRKFKVPAGKALPEICRDCAKLDEAERFDAVQLDEAGEPLPFVRVEASPPKAEFAEAAKAAEPAPKPESKPTRPP